MIIGRQTLIQKLRQDLSLIWTEETDVVIVGTGFSGLASALAALDLGADVIILEKALKPGGNSIISGGGANAVDPERQLAQGIEDSIGYYFDQTFEAGDCLAEPEKVRYLVENALEGCIRYLEKMGVNWSKEVSRGFGSLHERSHRVLNYKQWHKGGAAIIHAMLDQLQQRHQGIRLGNRVTGIIREDLMSGRVLGVEVEVAGVYKYIKTSKAVILATGGFAANLKWVSEYEPRLSELGTNNRSTATGECIRIAMNIGADTIHMNYIQAVPRKVRPSCRGMFIAITSEEIRKTSLYLPYRIFVNREGKRFVNEGGRRDTIAQSVLKQETFDMLPEIKANSIEELEVKLGIRRGNLINEITKYNSFSDMNNDLDFGKDANITIPLRTPFYQAESFSLLCHYTIGGLRTYGITGQVLDQSHNVIPGLYATGEVTGGVHGSNRLGDNSTVECIGFGTACGRHAATKSGNKYSGHNM